ncbi:hypothetical protein Tco_1433829 [Tanacetum coccineum]
MRRQVDGFSRDVTPLFDSMMVQATEEVDEALDYPLDQPSTSRPQKKQKPRRKQRKEIESPQHESEDEDHVPTFSNDPLPSGEDSSDINELMDFYLSLQEQVLDLQTAKDAQAKKIASLKKTIMKLQRKRRSRPAGLRRLKKFGARKNEAQEQLNEEEIFGVDDLHGEEVTVEDTATEVIVQDTVAETITTTETVTAAKEVTTVSGLTTTTIDELTLAQTLVEIAAKSKKVKAVTTAATSITTAAVTRPIAKEQVPTDKEYAIQLAVEMEAEVKKEERERRQKEEEANLALIELWESKKATMEADRLLVERLQAREREELTNEETSKLFVELMNKRKKHFTELRAQEKINKPPTKSQKRS